MRNPKRLLTGLVASVVLTLIATSVFWLPLPEVIAKNVFMVLMLAIVFLCIAYMRME
jgi:heme/copper-type cytochrome/quinol oxidase subunit 4